MQDSCTSASESREAKDASPRLWRVRRASRQDSPRATQQEGNVWHNPALLAWSGAPDGQCSLIPEYQRAEWEVHPTAGT